MVLYLLLLKNIKEELYGKPAKKRTGSIVDNTLASLKCHAYYETKLIRVDDLGIKQEKTREQSSKTVRDVTLTKRRLHTKTYQLYANVYECEDCGHVWKYNDRRLISDESKLEDADIH